MDHRSEQRWPLHLQADVMGSERHFVTRDISEWGVFVESSFNALPDTRVLSVALADTHSGARSAPLKMHIVHQEVNGVGLMVHDRESKLNMTRFLQWLV